MEPDAAEIRVLGCLIEKQRTTPDVYPLTLNALRLACNQSTNRDPVVDYGENEVRAALERYERVRVVHEAIASLDPAHREVLIMRDLEGRSGEETCRALGIETAAMKSRLHRARAQLRERIR